MSGLGREYADIEARLKRMRGVPKQSELLLIWERLERLDTRLPAVPRASRPQLAEASELAHQSLRGAWHELGITYEVALASYRNWLDDRLHPTVLSTPDLPAPPIPERPEPPEQLGLHQHPPIWDGFDR
ncbi:hypothetical protein [Nocardia goodfellowii]|uniref:Uncharacterized protein n=1 Tax=Nocardia goodfellowii TaxID=882446 RepID=A0ABS4QU07_9NOCA|nr:hypothetical protein [Nocardia goodfellowii]MBP2194529.1 hypothetical protein [Nocardia goodfellowii]